MRVTRWRLLSRQSWIGTKIFSLVSFFSVLMSALVSVLPLDWHTDIREFSLSTIEHCLSDVAAAAVTNASLMP